MIPPLVRTLSQFPMSPVESPSLRWSDIDCVFLDMDGTLLDLRFDNDFWLEIVPRRFAELNDLGTEEARRLVRSKYDRKRGSLDWYCLDYWSRELGFDVAGLTHAVRNRIEYLPEVPEFLARLVATGKRIVLVTNAHRDTLSIKVERTGLERHFHAMYSTHDFGLPKEEKQFWSRLRAIEDFHPARTLLVDDSLPVMRSAKAYGIGHIVAIRQPDSSAPPRQIDEFPSVITLCDLPSPDDS